MSKKANKTNTAKAFNQVAVGMSILLLSSLVTRAQNYSEFTMEVGTTNLIPNASPGIPVYPWFPDGHITMLPEGDTFQMYWAGSSSYRSTGPSISSQQRNPTTGSALSAGASTNDFDNGGAWPMSVFRQEGFSALVVHHQPLGCCELSPR